MILESPVPPTRAFYLTRAAQLAASFFLNQACDVVCWPLADIQLVPINGLLLRDKRTHHADMQSCLLMTHLAAIQQPVGVRFDRAVALARCML